VRRLAPRPLSAALTDAVGDVRPAGLLAAVQSAWSDVAGAALAAAASPAAEREGTVTVTCESAVWAHELELLGPELLTALASRLDGPLVTKFRFVVGSAPNQR